MNLLNPAFLVGFAAIAIPILIHILQRDRVRRIIFPATRFLLGASRKITRTQQWREIILLILRAMAMALLAFAFCRPFFTKEKLDEGGSGIAGSKAVVLLVDVSGSMHIGQRMDEAKKQALETLGHYRAQIDRVALVQFDHEPVVSAPMTGDLNQVRSAIDAIKPGFGGTNMAAAVQAADRILQADEVKNLQREIFLFSDLQRTGWAQFHGDWKLSPGVTMTVKPLSLKAVDNVAITQVAIPKSTVVSARNEALSLQIVNYSKQERPNTKVTLSVEGKAVEEKLVNLGPNKTEVVRFNYKFEKPGDCTGTLAVDVKDDFPEDNVYYFNVRVLPRVQVLLINGGPNSVAAKNDGLFFREALSVPGTPFQVREVQPDSVVAKDLEGVQAVVFTNVNVVPSGMTAPLKTFLENGGGIMVFPGDRVNPDEFNKSFAGLIPCRLKSISTKDDKSEGWTIGEIEFQHPIFTRFSTPQSGDFSGAKFSKYYSVTDSQAARVLARFTDGRPALLEQAFGKGFTLLFTSSAGLKWGDFCINGGVYVPFVHESMKYLSVHSEGITTAMLGESLQFSSPNVEVTSPDGTRIAVQQGTSTVTVTKVPGIYTVKDGDKDQRLAVNIPREESDPAALDSQELLSAIASNPDGEQKDVEGVKVWVQASASIRERIESNQRIGWYLLMALIVLLLGEHVLANNTSRR
jgi:hypothetical protein